MPALYQWRGDFENREVNALHTEAFGTRVVTEDERNWRSFLAENSFGWVTARDTGRLVGFVNVIWDGLVHAWIQDTMVAADRRSLGIGTRLIDMARDHAGKAGCEWLHVDFDDDLRDFYIGACRFIPTSAGLIHLPSGLSPRRPG
jgi:GNAT superfamily N-acetyltransferase